MFIVTAVETIGDTSGITEGGFGREATDKELSGSGIVPAALVAIILNIAIPKEIKDNTYEGKLQEQERKAS